MGQGNRLGGWNLVPKFRTVAHRLEFTLRGQRFQVSDSIQQRRINDPGMSFATGRKDYDLLVLQASRFGESAHAQVC